MTIRVATPDDISTIAELIRGAFRVVADRFGLTPENCPKHPSNYTTNWVRRDMDRGVTYFLLEEEGRAVGCVAVDAPRPGVRYVERLAVAPSRQRRGLGRALMDHALDEARRSGAATISLGIIAAQTELREWYKRLGFVVTETKDFAHLPFRVTLMSYSIR